MCPDWLVYNPKRDADRLVKFDEYAELVECITAWLVMARDEYGVEITYLSVNEPNIGAQVSFSGRELTTLILDSESEFKKNKLNTRWLLADTSNTAGSANFARTMLNNARLKS